MSPTEITLIPAGSIEGSVVDSTGARLRGTELMPLPASPLAAGVEKNDLQHLPIGITDGAGDFRIDGLPPGRVMIYQRADKGRWWPSRPLQVEIVAGRTTRLQLVLPAEQLMTSAERSHVLDASHVFCENSQTGTAK